MSPAPNSNSAKLVRSQKLRVAGEPGPCGALWSVALRKAEFTPEQSEALLSPGVFCRYRSLLVLEVLVLSHIKVGFFTRFNLQQTVSHFPTPRPKMRFTSFLSAVVVLLGATLANGCLASQTPIQGTDGASVNPKSLPPFEHLYSFSLELTENHLVDGPLGSRLGTGFSG